MGDGSALDLATAIGMMNRNNDRNYDDGFGFGGGAVWILIILFFICGMGGWNNGFSGFGNNGFGVAMNDITNEFLFTNLNNSVQRGFEQSTNQNFMTQQQLCQGFGDVRMAIAENRFAGQNCCCEINRNIDQLRYDGAKNTCDIITSVNAVGQRVIDQMQQDKIDQLRNQLNLTQSELSQSQQTAAIVNALRPIPSPAYLTCSPYQSINLLGLLNGLNGNGCGGYGWNYNFG